MAAEGRRTRGRQRIPMQLIQNQDDLYASFSKRRLGLFKKGSELSTLCGADVGIIVFSPTDNPFSFFSPNMDTVVDRYRHPNRPLNHSVRAIDAHTRARIDALNKRLDELTEEKVKLKARQAQLEEADKSREKAWWEETAVDGLTKEQVEEWKAWFSSFKSRLENRMAQIQTTGAGSTSSALNVGGAGPNPTFVAPAPAPYFGSASEQFGGVGMQDQYGGATATAAAAAMNLPGGSGGGLAQYLLSSPPLDPFFRRDGAGSSSYAFSPPFRFSMSPEGPDPFAAGSSGGGESVQYGFQTAAPAYVDEAGGSGKGKEIMELLPQSLSSDEIPYTDFCLTPDYDPVGAEGENPSAAGEKEEEEEEAAASNEGEGKN